MLVLTRRLEQAIAIGDPLSLADAIEVTVLEVRGDQVRRGIKAPALFLREPITLLIYRNGCSQSSET